MTASPPVSLVTRKAVVIGVIAFAVIVAAAVYAIGLQSASGTDDAKSSAFAPVGDGSLPTKKPSLGAIGDPLSTAETGYAMHVAATDASIPSDATNVNGDPIPEILWADVPSEDVTDRSATVMLYDYTSNKGYQQLVNLETGKVVDSQSSDIMQPPTSSDEADVAIELALANKDLEFLKEFEDLEGVPLVSKDQIHYVAGAWSFDKTTSGGQECGKDRCAQIMVQTASGGYLSTFDFVVNLSTKSIVSIN